MAFSPPAFPKLPRYRGEADPLHAVKRVVCLEKIDGANTRIGVPQGAKDAAELSVGGRVLLEHEAGFSERALVNTIREDQGLVERLLALSTFGDVSLYGETCGGKIQRMGFIYGSKPHFLLFAAHIKGAWCSLSRPTSPALPTVRQLAERAELQLAPTLYEGEPDPGAFDQLLDQPSRHSLEQGFDRKDVDRTQEGIVIWADPMLLDPYGVPLFAKHKHPDRREYAPPTSDKVSVADFAQRAILPERVEHARQYLRAAGKWSDDSATNEVRLIRRVIQDVSKEVPEYQTQLGTHGKKAVRAALEEVARNVIKQA